MHLKRVNSSCLCRVYWLWSVLDLMGPHNEMTASLMQSFRKQYLKLVLLSSLKYVTNEIFLYKMTNGHLNIFINQFHFDSLLDQGHFVNALNSTLAHFIAQATPLLTAYSSHPFCKAKAPLKWNIGVLKLVIEQNGNYSVTEAHKRLSVASKTSYFTNSERLFVFKRDALCGARLCWMISFWDLVGYHCVPLLVSGKPVGVSSKTRTWLCERGANQFFVANDTVVLRSC